MAIDPTLKTERLLLRQWCQDDHSPFAAMNADPEVMAHFPSTLDRSSSDALAEKFAAELTQHGWGLWALERQDTHEFVGFTGLNAFTGLPIADGIEIGWRLTRSAWGLGFASEAANRVLRFAFTELMLAELVSFTATSNFRSIAVMRRIGMQDSGTTFLHPRVPADSPLREHVLYRMDKIDWQRS